MSGPDQESVPTTRRSPKTLQRSVSDSETLVGRLSKSLKRQLPQETSIDVEVKKKNLSSKDTQASILNKVTVDDLTNPEDASENYWKILAEKLKVALQDALHKNEKLYKISKEVDKDIGFYKEVMDEASRFVERVQSHTYLRAHLITQYRKKYLKNICKPYIIV